MSVYVSSSIANFEDKIRRKFKPKDPVFFGMYTWRDYIRYLLCRGRKKIFWCGGDIPKLTPLRAWLVKRARHICENEPEQAELRKYGIHAAIHPCLFDDVPTETHFSPSAYPHVYICAHPGREEEYGVATIESIARYAPDVTFHVYGISGSSDNANVVYHGKVDNEQFNEEIKGYHAALRLNYRDGFSEVLAKSVLMGQYPVSRISYPHIDTFGTEFELICLLKRLRGKTEPNHKAQAWWQKRLQESSAAIVDN